MHYGKTTAWTSPIDVAHKMTRAVCARKEFMTVTCKHALSSKNHIHRLGNC